MGRLGAISFGEVRVHMLRPREIWSLSVGARQTGWREGNHDWWGVEICLVDGDLYIRDSQTKTTLNSRLKLWGAPRVFLLTFVLGIDSNTHARHNLVHLTIIIINLLSRTPKYPTRLFTNRDHVSQAVRSCHPFHSRSLCCPDQTSSSQV